MVPLIPPGKSGGGKRTVIMREVVNGLMYVLSVVAVFMGLQNAWRRQGTLRRTFDGMPSSQEEREGWKQLIQHLTQLPPLRR